jgi:hypothetical protein
MSYWNTVRQRMNSLVGRYEDFELVINGVPLTSTQIAAFRRLTGLLVLEPGRFWFDAGTGAMGREGSRVPLYQLYANTATPINRGSSLSARRSLFSQADLSGVWTIGDDYLVR